MDIGVSRAGFEVKACIEVDPYCCQTLRAAAAREGRNPHILETDIRTIDPSTLQEQLGLKAGELDLLYGGPPCQPFSQIGKRGCMEDARGLLLFEMIRYAETFRPKILLIEQVKGLLNAPDEIGKVGGVFDRLLAGIQTFEYTPKWKVVLAADYGVAQLRQRVFVVCVQKPYAFDFPAPTHGSENPDTSLFPLPQYATVGDVICGLDAPSRKSAILKQETMSGLNVSSCDDSHFDVTPEGDRRRIHGVPEGSHLAKELHLPAEQRCNLTKKDTTKFRRLSRFEPANTLRCGEIFFHPLEDRYLTPREYMRIHGYPDDYQLKGPIRGRSGQVRHLDQHRQVANSVPPPVAYVLAQAIRRSLNAAHL